MLDSGLCAILGQITVPPYDGYRTVSLIGCCVAAAALGAERL